MHRTIRLTATALIGLVIVGCLIPVPVGHDRHRGDHRYDRDRHYDQDGRDRYRRDWDRWDRDRGDWRRDRDYDRRDR